MKPEEQVREVIDRLVPEVLKHFRDEGIDDRVLMAHPRATRAAIAALEQHHQVTLPPLYRAFLELHDGYDWLVPPGGMLSIADQLPGSVRYSEILQWKKQCALYGSAEVMDGIVIAHQNRANDYVYLDPTDRDDRGEFAAVLFTPEHSRRYRDLLEFFESRIVYCRLVIPDEPDAG